jgi:Tol biopolymer transport system component
LANPDGSPGGRLYQNDLPAVNHLSWSLDGETILLATTWEGINLLSTSDGSVRNLADTVQYTIISYASFSPDGSSIAFFAYNEGSIFLVDAAGAWLRELTPDSSYRNSSEFPSWSPSGDVLLFSRRPNVQIFLMDPEGNGVRQLTTSGCNENPVFSPDGRWIAFIRTGDTNTYLYLMDPEGGGMRALTDDITHVISFSWSPDGRYIVFSYHLNNVSTSITKYRIVDIHTGTLVELDLPSSGNFNVAWSPRMNAAEPMPDCTAGWSRVKIGDLVSIVGDSPTRVRSEPVKGENVVGQFPPGESYTIVGGSVCADGLVFWQMADPTLPGGAGWTAEGDGTEYYLEPYLP